MALQLKSPLAAAALSALALLAAALLAATVALGVGGARLSGEVARLREELEGARKRVSDLEAENDYLFEEREDGAAAKRHAAPLPDLCRLDPDPGPCGSRATRWFFDVQGSGDCAQFTWGGCRGNENNFLSISQCRAACNVSLSKPVPPSLYSPELRPGPRLGPPGRSSHAPLRSRRPGESSFDRAACQLPPDSGPCGERIPRFFHSGGRCLRFNYGGCSGNMNNFFTKHECESRCLSHNADMVNSIVERVDFHDINNGGGAAPRPPLCHLPADRGHRCAGSGLAATEEEEGEEEEKGKTRFHFDPARADCAEFDYAGCGGNENNFVSVAKCRKKCA